MFIKKGESCFYEKSVSHYTLSLKKLGFLFIRLQFYSKLKPVGKHATQSLR